MDPKQAEMMQQGFQLLAQAMAGQENVVKEYDFGGLKFKTPAAVHTGQLLFGSSGLWSVPGIAPDVINAYVRPYGLLSRLPRYGGVNENPYFASITGFAAESGSEPATPCADAPTGYMKGALLTAQFGRVQRDTQTIEWNKVMSQKNSGINTDLQMRGSVLGLTDFNVASASESQILSVVTAMEMVTAGVNLERKLTRMAWSGTPANNNAGGGYKEFPGLDVQIATGQKDAASGALAPALDSFILNFGTDLIGGAGRSIVEYMTMMEYTLRYNAEKMGLDPVTWIIAMRPEMWYALTEVWPCNYNTYRCRTDGSTTANPVVINDNANVLMRDEMRRSNRIEINGTSYEVVTDVGITELTNITTAGIPAGQFASSIYFIPLTIAGGLPVTYLEYMNYMAGQADIDLVSKGPISFWTDGGMYSWAAEFVKWCYKLSVKIEPRIVLRTPFLAGRIDMVRYAILSHLRDPFADSVYNQDGGVSIRGSFTDTKQAVWL